MNAVGYSNPGLKESKKEFSDLSHIPVPVFASVVAKDAEGFALLVRELEEINFAAIELPLSCPHTPGFGVLAGQSTPEATTEIVQACRKETKKPLIVKVSPNVHGLSEIAKAAERAGADAISAVNSLGPGMVIDVNSATPILSFKVGGVSGQPLHPIAVRCVYDIFEAVKIPIIGIGGASTGKEAIELLQAGASLVGIGTGTYLRGIDVFKKICNELSEWMEINGFKKVKELIGIAHK
jgi:dihydroorotate dehydrogenase (NAD+) catalytic subunit